MKKTIGGSNWLSGTAILSMLIALAACGKDSKSHKCEPSDPACDPFPPARDPSAVARLIYYEVGPDHQFDTADDVPTNYQVYQYALGGTKATRIYSYDGAGSNGIWLDGDDRLAGYTSLSYEPSSKKNHPVRYARFADPGPDGLWFSADDPIAMLETRQLDANGNELNEILQDAREDGILGTADDYWQYSSCEYDSAGNRIKYVGYENRGPDGLPVTADDVVEQYSTYQYDQANREIRDVWYLNPGLDETWFTADDPAEGYWESQYDVAGNLVQQLRWSAGPDGKVGTGDDHLDSGERWTFDAGNHQTSDYTFGSGADGIAGTADDVGWQYFTMEYNAAGEEITSIQWDLGPDKKGGTPDDRIMSRRTTTYDAQNRPVKARVEHYGADEQFGTADDRLSYEVREY